MSSPDNKIFLSQANQAVPPLPPRSSHSSTSSLLEPPPAHANKIPSYHSQEFDQSYFLQDPRSASTQSLLPTENSNGKRTLLLIYLHGFLGSETSFHSFPAHVHSLVSLAVAKTHVVHTKIYPRYRSRKAIEHARNEFSSWLRPNESTDTDIVLLGHSMGGILSAEVALLTSPSSDISGAQQFRHRILGTINFDSPFLGMHPGIVFSGIKSLFRPAPSSSEIQSPHPNSGLSLDNSPRASSPLRTPLPSSHTSSDVLSGSSAPSPIDENFLAGASEDSRIQSSTGKDSSIYTSPSNSHYDPPFPNDVRLPERKGWDGTLHFITKHSHDLTKAATAYVTSHLEFGSCVADYKGLQNRYMKLRPLEDIQGGSRRVRFLNYYTICHGRPKKPKPAAESGYGLSSGTADAQNTVRQHSEPQRQDMRNPSLSTRTTQSPLPSPRISVEEHKDGEVEVLFETAENFQSLQVAEEENPTTDEYTIISTNKPGEIASGQPEFSSNMPERSTELVPSALTPTRSHSLYSLAPLPSLPEAPQQFDPASYSDRTSRNLAYKQYSAEFKSYMRALKAYDQAINDRLKSIEKQEKINEKSKKLSKAQEGKKPRQPSTSSPISLSKSERLPTSPFPIEMPESSNNSHSSPGSNLSPQTALKAQKVEKDRRFCVLPPRINGQRDPCWVRVFLKDVDEVGAHCGLFVPGDHYGWFVDDVATRIRSWVEERGYE